MTSISSNEGTNSESFPSKPHKYSRENEVNNEEFKPELLGWMPPRYSWEDEVQSEEFKPEPLGWMPPRQSWEDEVQSQEFKPEPLGWMPPRYSWEDEVQSEEFKPEPLGWMPPRQSWEDEVQSEEFKREIQVHGDCEDAQKQKKNDMNIDVHEPENQCEGTTSHSEDNYFEDAQRPQSPVLNLDFDAIQRELIDPVLHPPSIHQKRKKRPWYRRFK